jgi:hypothetical protein
MKDSTTTPSALQESIMSNPTLLPLPMIPLHIDGASGWGGLGLRGNRSSGNLQRSTSDASGLFIDEEGPSSSIAEMDEDPDNKLMDNEESMPQQQSSGERTSYTAMRKPPSATRLQDVTKKASDPAFSKYMKTSSMAKFYYRRSREYSDEGEALLRQPPTTTTASRMRKTTSDVFVSTRSTTMTTPDHDAGGTSSLQPPSPPSSTATTPRSDTTDRHARRKSKSFPILPDSFVTETTTTTEEQQDEEEIESQVTWEPLKG